MTLTVKERPETTVPSTRTNPVCLEVSVTVRSLPGETGSDPAVARVVQEEGRTVIVFDNGAVLRLSNNLPAGQKIIVSNLQGREVVCQVVSGRNLPTIKGYIEVEFTETVSDFWHLHTSGQTAATPALNLVPTPTPVQAAPQPPLVVVKPSPPAPVASTVAAPIAPVTKTVPEEKTPANQPGRAPSFEDVAGLVRMAAPPVTRVKPIEPAPQLNALKNKMEGFAEAAKSRPKVEQQVLNPETISAKAQVETAPPTVEEIVAPQVQKPATPQMGSHDSMGLGMAAVPSSSSSMEGGMRSRIPLIIGGAALVLAGFGAGFFFMHQGSTQSPAPAAVTAQTPQSSSGAQNQQVAQPSLQQPQAIAAQPPAQSQGITVVENVAPSSADSSASDARNSRQAGNSAEDKTSDRPSKQRPIPNLKMGAPSAPRQTLARNAENSVPSVTDAVSTGPVGTPASSAMLSSMVRSENQPAPPPPAFVPSASAKKTVTEPRLITATRPTYPVLAKQSNTQGTVVVSAEVEPSGIVTNVKAVSGPVSLRQAAIDAVKQWKYSPALIDGKPAGAQVNIDVQFRLN